MRIRAVLLVALLASSAAFAAGQSVLMPGTSEVDELFALYQQAGRAFPETSFPIAKGELDALSAQLISAASPELLPRIQAYRTEVLHYAPSRDRISASASTDFEYYYRTQNVSMEPGLPAAEQYQDLQRLFLGRAPLATVQLDFSREDRLELVIQADIQREYFMNPFNTTNLWESAPEVGNPVALENQDIMRGALWYNFDPLQVELGRDKVQMGPEEHSLLPSSRLPFLDMLRLRLPLGRLTGDLLISTLENRDSFGQAVTSTTLLAVHRYEYAFDTVRLGIAGMVVLSRADNSYWFGDIFPVFSWHNANIIPNNMSLVADASWVPLPGLVLNVQAGLDDVNTTGIGVADSGVPTIPAVILSGGYLLPLGADIRLDFHAELGYTHYLWGNFDDLGARGIYKYLVDGGSAIIPLTSPYGPGATWVELSARVSGIPWLDASVNARYLSRMTSGSGTVVDLVSTAYQSSSAIENAPHVDTWSIGFKAAALPFGFLRVTLEPTLYVQENYAAGTQTVWAEVSVGAGVFGESVSYIER